MSWDGITERRKHRRARLRMHLACAGKEGGTGTGLETLNLSAGGFYCRVDHPIEPLTRLGLRFVFPPFGTDHPGERVLECEGVVVRCERDPAQAGTHRIAACFIGLSREERRHIEGYVDWHLEVYADCPEDAAEAGAEDDRAA
jgi:hypothetical protein